MRIAYDVYYHKKSGRYYTVGQDGTYYRSDQDNCYSNPCEQEDVPAIKDLIFTGQYKQDRS